MIPIHIVSFYSQEDFSLHNKLQRHLKPMTRQGLITYWCDQKINAGEQWRDEINLQLKKADIILILISSDFIDSHYMNIVEAHQQNMMRKTQEMISVLLRSCDWKYTQFGDLMVLPANEKPVKDKVWKEEDEALLAVVQGIRSVVEKLQHEIKNKTFESEKQSWILDKLDGYNQILKSDSQHIRTLINKAEALYDLERYEEALDIYRNVKQRDPENAELQYEMGRALFMLELFDEAIVAFNKAIEVNYNLVKSYEWRSRARAAVAQYDNIKAKDIRAQAKVPGLSSSQPVESNGRLFMRLGELIKRGKVRVGELVYVDKRPDQFAEVIDGRRVKYQGKEMLMNEWASNMASWTAINIYKHVYLRDTGQLLGDLRD